MCQVHRPQVAVCTPHQHNTLAMIPTYGRVLSAIEKVLWELVEEYQGVGRSL